MKITNTAASINKYLTTRSAELNSSKFPLEHLDLKRIEGIQTEIPLFKNSTMEDIKFLTKWFQVLNIARGCREKCTFCLRNAMAPIKESADKINTILWEDLQRFTDGFAKLSERIGVNTLKGNSHITLFEDANLPAGKIHDLNGDIHNAGEAIKNIYEKLQLPFVFATSGWHLNDKFTQNTAEEICSYILKNKECSKEFAISVNPFYSGDRNAYIAKITNALKTFLPLYKNDVEKGSILLKYNYPNGVKNELNGRDSAIELYQDIHKNLQKVTDSNLEEYELLKPQNVTQHREDNYIENKGRGQKFFPKELVDKNNKQLFTESFHWLTLTPAEKQKFAYEFTTKNIDINGKVYLITPSEQLIDTGIKLNYINKNKETAKIHSDIHFMPLSL